MKQYPKYKPSGIEWIGDIPEGWKVKKIKEIKATTNNSFVDGPFGSNLKSEHFIDNGEVYVIESGFVTSGKFIEKEFKTISIEHFETIKRSECVVGDIIISKIGANYGSSAILPKLPKISVVSGNSLKLTTNDELSNNIFINYALQDHKRSGCLELIVSINAQPALTLGEMNNIKIPLPPLSEQKAIAEYLDKATQEIDSIISIKEKQIELMEQYFRSKLHETVTGKNLEEIASVSGSKSKQSSIKRKPSGIDWIGDIPEHWKIEKLKRIININSGDSIKVEEIVDDGKNYVFGGNGVIGKTNLCNFNGTALIIGRVGAKCGNVHIISGLIWVTDNALLVTLTGDYKYYYYLLNSMNLNDLSRKNAQPLITGTDIKKQPFPLPPLSEQKALAEYLDSLQEKTDSVCKVLQEQIEVLKNYRKSLIHECVTGKRKVI